MTFCTKHFDNDDENFLYNVIPPDWRLTPVLLKSISDSKHRQGFLKFSLTHSV